LLASFLASGCASLAPEPARPSLLGGDWALDPAASGDYDAAVTTMLTTWQERLRANMRRRDAALGSVDAADASRLPLVPAESSDRVRTRLAETLQPPAGMHIELGTESVSIRSGSEPARTYYPGQRIGLIDTTGAARVTSGWSGPVFLIEARYGNGVRRSQRYTLQAQGNELLVTLKYTDPLYGSLELHSLYRRK
jgi:hypothetical protein